MSVAHRVLECRVVDELIEVQRQLSCASLEAVVADSQGAVASVVTGQVDRSPSRSGAYLRCLWEATERQPTALPEDLRPVCVRPAAGFVASANHGGNGRFTELWSTLPQPSYRFDRISELLQARAHHTVESVVRIAYDTFDRCAARLLPIWEPLLPRDPLASALCRWGRAQHDVEYLGLFHRIHSELCIAWFARYLGEETASRLRDKLLPTQFQCHLDDLFALERPDLLDASTLRELLGIAFQRALTTESAHELPIRMRFKHLLTQGLTPAVCGFDSPIVHLPGGPMGPFATRSVNIAGGRVIGGPVFHIAMDLQKPGLWYNIAGGASERRWGPGYGRGVDEWLHGKLLPLGNAGAGPLYKAAGGEDEMARANLIDEDSALKVDSTTP